MHMKKIICIALLAMAASTMAQEMCFTCSGTYYVRGHRAGPEQNSEGHSVGFCVNRNNMEVTYDTQGSTVSKWRFFERVDSVGTVYYYWRKEYDNGIFGRLSEQIELSDVKLHYQYVAKDIKDGRSAIAVNAKCTPVQRIGK
jgi:hypothetical protein